MPGYSLPDTSRRLKLPAGSLRAALDGITQALGSMGDAGQQARRVVEELRTALQQPRCRA